MYILYTSVVSFTACAFINNCAHRYVAIYTLNTRVHYYITFALPAPESGPEEVKEKNPGPHSNDDGKYTCDLSQLRVCKVWIK